MKMMNSKRKCENPQPDDARASAFRGGNAGIPAVYQLMYGWKA
jgi:hypothetical protein